jgi:hypothetical protein
MDGYIVLGPDLDSQNPTQYAVFRPAMIGQVPRQKAASSGLPRLFTVSIVGAPETKPKCAPRAEFHHCAEA